MICIANDSTRYDIHIVREHRRGLVRYHFDTAHVDPEAFRRRPAGQRQGQIVVAWSRRRTSASQPVSPASTCELHVPLMTIVALVCGAELRDKGLRCRVGASSVRFDLAFSVVGGCWGPRKIGTNIGWDSHNGWDQPGRKRHLLRRL
ncbi:hypothetical protein OHS81_35420 [Streptomyces sp. NBC_00400]|uniref:hypothetical protein n=1 Tax=Streptomyces sp. NBC_00400 TaxID=2975737 RepID=UPI002E1B8A7A